MTSPTSEPRTSRLYHARRGGTVFTAGGAVLLTCAAVATMLVVGIGTASSGAPLFLAVAAGQLAMALLVVAVARRVSGPELAATLGFRMPPVRALVGATLLGATCWFVNMWIVSQLPMPSHEGSTLEKLVTVPPLWAALLAIAVVPAICEEIVFRGVLARSLVARSAAKPGGWSVGFAVIVSAALFSGYHLSILQMIPTFVLGLVLAHVALCSDSVVPAMVTHFLNNAIALSIARGEVPGLANALSAHPAISLVACIVVAALGYALAITVPRVEARR